MSQPQSWNELLQLPTYIVGKYEDASCDASRVSTVGFKHITRWSDHDAPEQALTFDPIDTHFMNDEDEMGVRSTCFAHLSLWKHMIDTQTACCVVFEADVVFHKDWNALAPQYFDATPKDYDVCFIGHRYGGGPPFHIRKTPVIGTYAMIVTLQGATRMYDKVLNDTRGIMTLDCLLNRYMVTSMTHAHSNDPAHAFLNWYVWNASMFPDTTAAHTKTLEDAGLVFMPRVTTSITETITETITEPINKPINKPTKVLVVVMSCHKHQHLWKGILDKGVDDLIIIVGNEDMHGVYPPLMPDALNVQKPARLEGHMLYLGCNDCYEGLPMKIVKMIDFVLHSDRFNHITHILKIDDHDNVFEKSTIENIHRLDELRAHDFIGQKLNTGDGMRNYHIPYVSVNSHWRNKLYEGMMVPWLHGGSSYILSRKAMRVINAEYNVRTIDHVNWHEIFEDVMVAKTLRKNNIYPKEMNYGVIGDRP